MIVYIKNIRGVNNLYLSGPFLSLLFCDLQNTKNIKSTNKKKIAHLAPRKSPWTVLIFYD